MPFPLLHPQGDDYSFAGTGSFSIDGQPTANGLLTLSPDLEQVQVATPSLSLASRRQRSITQRINGWVLTFAVSDITPQIRDLSENGSATYLSVEARIKNETNSKIEGLVVTASARFVPTLSAVNALNSLGAFASVSLTAYAADNPIFNWTDAP